MSSKNSVQVLIAGKIVNLSGYESEEYLQKVASYLSHKTAELSGLRVYKHMSQAERSSMLALNAADDYFKAKEKADSLEEMLEQKDQEIYDLKQQIVDLKVKLNGKNTGSSPNTSGSSGPAGRRH